MSFVYIFSNKKAESMFGVFALSLTRAKLKLLKKFHLNMDEFHERYAFVRSYMLVK